MTHVPQEAHVTLHTVFAHLDTHCVLEEAHLGAQVDTEQVVTQYQLTPPTLPDHQLARHALRQAVQVTQLGVLPGGIEEDTGQVVRQLDKEEVTVTRGQQICGTVGLLRFGRGYRGHETRERRLDIVRVIIVITVKSINPLPERGFNVIIIEI